MLFGAFLRDLSPAHRMILVFVDPQLQACVVLKSLLRQVFEALDSVDECQCYAAVALVAIEAAVLTIQTTKCVASFFCKRRARSLLITFDHLRDHDGCFLRNCRK